MMLVAPPLVDLATNLSLDGPAPAALDVLRAAGPDLVARYAEPLAPRLCRAVAADVGVAPDEVVAGCGSDDLIDTAFRALVPPGGTVAMPSPTFESAALFAGANRVSLRRVPLTPGLAPDLDGLASGDPAAIYLCSPNNPTGSRVAAGAVEELLARIAGIVVLDEAYVEFDGRSLAPRAPALERLVVLRTFSKAWGLAGLRVGYAIGSRALIARIAAALGPYKVSALAEEAAIAALAADRGWMEAAVARTCRARDALIESLRQLGHAPLPSSANFVCLPVPDALAARERLKRHGVLVRAFRGLDRVGDAIRIGIGPPEAMTAVQDALAGMAR